MDPQGPGRLKTNASVKVTKEEIERQLYQPLPEEWHGLHSPAECKRISRGLEQVMSLAIGEPFNYPVDLTHYPDYMLEIDYPMDFRQRAHFIIEKVFYLFLFAVLRCRDCLGRLQKPGASSRVAGAARTVTVTVTVTMTIDYDDYDSDYDYDYW